MHFAIEPIFDVWWPTLLFLLGGAAILWFEPKQTRWSPKQQQTLKILRGLSLLLLGLAMSRPTLIRKDQKPQPASLAVLLDGSQSMSFPAADPRRTRQEEQATVLDRLSEAISATDEQLQWRYFGYSENTKTLSAEEARAFSTEPPAGKVTDVNAPLVAAIAEADDPPLAGVILLGDGTHTANTPGPQSGARSLAALQLPLWTIPLGARATGEQQRDVAISDVPELLRVFAKNQLVVRGSLTARGLAGAVLPVRLTLIDQAGAATELAARELRIGGPEESQAFSIEVTAPAPGNYQLVVESEPQTGEAIALNNRQVAFLEVADGGGRVLYLEGEPRQEQMFLRRSLAASPDLQIAFSWLERDPNRWPVDLKQLIDPNSYDVLILGDLDSAAFGNEQLQQIATSVGEGKGLLLLGGLRAFDAGGYAETPLADAFPIGLDRNRRRRLGDPPRADSQLPPPVPFIPRSAHPILRLGGEPADDATRWAGVAPLQGANRLQPPKSVPGVELLAASPDAAPLLIAGEYGSGRVLAFAGDSSWQWYREPRTRDIHQRFWRQAVLWLLGRDDASNSLRIDLEKRRYRRDEAILVDVSWRESTGTAAPTIELLGPDGTSQPVTLAMVPQSMPPRYTARLAGLTGGVYRITGQDQTGATLASTQFEIVETDPERLRPLADVGLMEQLAALTEPAGGQSYAPDAVDELIKRIRELRGNATQTVIERTRLGEGPFSGWLLFGGWVATYGTLWFLRRRWGGV
jgi:uncharacterized membrane protein